MRVSVPERYMCCMCVTMMLMLIIIYYNIFLFFWVHVTVFVWCICIGSFIRSLECDEQHTHTGQALQPEYRRFYFKAFLVVVSVSFVFLAFQ